jgi:hypothetical protein
VAKHAIVVMSEPGEANPGGQGRMVHAMTTVRDLKAAGQDVSLWFHGIGVTWLSAFDARTDPFTQHYGSLFDEVRPLIAGSCEFCTKMRFGAGPSADRLGVRTVGGTKDHHSVASLLSEGHQVLIF